MNAEIIFFVLHQLTAITIVYHISYQCAIMSKNTYKHNITGSACNRLIR